MCPMWVQTLPARLIHDLGWIRDDGGEEGAGDGASPCPASLCLSASSVAPSNWLNAVQVLALLLTTVTKRLVGTGLGGRGGGGASSGTLHNVYIVQ